MIKFVDVVRKYGTKVAVNGLTMDVHPGEVFAFLGPNGAGKTTTIKMMVGLLLPSKGQVQLAGYDVQTEPRLAKSHLGFVPDQPELYDKLSGREFLDFVGSMHGMKRDEIVASIETNATLFELHEFLDQLTENYSHGMKQRVAFAAALIHDPDVLILDEPLVGLDPRSMRLVKDMLRDRASRNKTVFLSTHTLAVAEEVSDRIGVIHEGELIFLGTLAELRSRMEVGHSSLEDLFLMLTDKEAPHPLEQQAQRHSANGNARDVSLENESPAKAVSPASSETPATDVEDVS